jgi:hypothetical protein
MQGNYNPRIVGATVLGFALVVGAFTYQSMNRPAVDLAQQATINQALRATSAPPRVAIEVTDNDGNGIEDWRDEFVTTEPVVLDRATSSTYEPPDTLTGQAGIQFMQGIIRSKGFGPFGSTQEEVIDGTVKKLSDVTAHEIYDTPDITILEEWDDQDIRNYANTAAAVVYRHSIPDMEGELVILHDILNGGNTDRVSELRTLAQIYKNYRDDTLKIPVPAFLAKEHLDVINTYHAVYKDIEAMTVALDDPARTLMHVKRYQDDASGLALAYDNMFEALFEYSHLFYPEDPATMFTGFSPDYQFQ